MEPVTSSDPGVFPIPADTDQSFRIQVESTAESQRLRYQQPAHPIVGRFHLFLPPRKYPGIIHVFGREAHPTGFG